MVTDQAPLPVVLTEQALADLLQVGATIRRDSPARAETFVAELYECCQSLGEAPLAYARLPGWEEHGIRRRPYGSYLIFYRINSDAVEVLHVLHGARDYDAILLQNEEKP